MNSIVHIDLKLDEIEFSIKCTLFFQYIVSKNEIVDQPDDENKDHKDPKEDNENKKIDDEKKDINKPKDIRPNKHSGKKKRIEKEMQQGIVKSIMIQRDYLRNVSMI